MIKATILHNNEGMAVGFIVKSHGNPIVCSAVSMLVINTVNSIQMLTALTEADYCFKCNDSGFIAFALRRSSLRNTGAGLLLDALVLGLDSVNAQYPKDIKFDTRHVSS